VHRDNVSEGGIAKRAINSLHFAQFVCSRITSISCESSVHGNRAAVKQKAPVECNSVLNITRL
jgi:hypothetical protein